jgi:kynurenine formamidase
LLSSPVIVTAHGTHLDAPGALGHREGRRGCVADPAAAAGRTGCGDRRADRVAADPDFLLEVDDVRQWEAAHGPLPAGGWLLLRTGWDARSGSQEEFLNADETGPHTPGISVEAAKWLAEEAPVIGVGVETVGTDAGAAHSFDPPFPCHTFVLGAGKYGLTQLQNLNRLPPTGAVVIAAPLPIVGGSGSPIRVLALIER